jgi:membrane-associated protein
MLDFILHINENMQTLVTQNADLLYLILTLIIFGETGLVILPFLPGDSMLFAAGALSAGEGLNIWILLITLIPAAILGNCTNYLIGRKVGEWVIRKGWISAESLQKTHNLYEKFGGFAVVAARFLPLFRTYVPFVAGSVRMPFGRFLMWSTLGAGLWVCGFCIAGFYLGQIPFIKDNLNVIVLVGLAAAAVPVIIGVLWKIFKKTYGKKK